MSKIEKIKSQSRSFKAWFKFLPDELREKAIMNLILESDPVDISQVVPFTCAIDRAFAWGDSPEKEAFWAEINDAWLAGDYLPQQSRFKVGDRVYSKADGLGSVASMFRIKPGGYFTVRFLGIEEFIGTRFSFDGYNLSKDECDEYHRVHRLTEMQAYVIFTLQYSVDSHETYNPVQLEADWAKLHNRRLPLASRHRFGATASAYKCMYSLEKMGIIRRVDTGSEYDYFYELVKQEA